MIEHIKIKPIEYFKVFRTLCNVAQAYGTTIFEARCIIQQSIEAGWKRAWAAGNLQAQANWNQLFPPDRCPTVSEFIVTLAREMMTGKNPPYLL